MKNKEGNIFVYVLGNDETICPVCEQKLFNRIVPKTDIKGKFCNRCHIYFVKQKEGFVRGQEYNLLTQKAISSFKKTYNKISQMDLRKIHPNRERTKRIENNRGKEGFCIKCGEKAFLDKMYCFECFKQEKSS